MGRNKVVWSKLGHGSVPSFVPMVNSEYSFIRETLMSQHDVIVPTKETIGLSNSKLWRIFDRKSMSLQVEMQKGEKYLFEFLRGFNTDYGSIPTIGKMLISPDDPRALISFLVHDSAFKLKCFGNNKAGFKKANKLLFEMCLYYKVPRPTAQIILSAVNSPIGYNVYKTCEDRDTIPYCKFTEL